MSCVHSFREKFGGDGGGFGRGEVEGWGEKSYNYNQITIKIKIIIIYIFKKEILGLNCLLYTLLVQKEYGPSMKLFLRSCSLKVIS